jgi:uncharacterized membrane protein YdjX (TVP38/TMEM64 family)
MRFVSVAFFFAALVLLIFFLWGDSFSFIFSQAEAIVYFKSFEQWAWAVAFLLLIGDIILPLPATIIMSSLGYIYGPVIGGMLSVIGSFLSGAAGYWLCRMIGDRAARRILGDRDYIRGKGMSEKVTGLIVALSRWMPVFPEVISCMAGLTRMRPIVFHLALLCGSLPLGFGYAYIGFSGIDNPTLAMILSAGVPPLIWLTVRWIFRRKLGIVRPGL